MAITTDEFQAFSKFGLARIATGDEPLSLDDLVVEWDSKHHRQSINSAIREGLADVEAGRIRPADEAMAELREKHGLTAE